MSKGKYRRPEPSEQRVLDHLTVRPIRAKELSRYRELMCAHHYLKEDHLVGEQIRYVISYRTQWLALGSWCACARFLKARDQFIGWTAEQCRRRRALIANNARFLILPDCHYPNLASRALKLMLARLSEDWQRQYGHPIALAETFVDPAQFCGTIYRCSGWTELGLTKGWARSGEDYYLKHERPKKLWIKPLVKKACEKLRAQQLAAAWAQVEEAVAPRCSVQAAQMKSLTDRLAADVPEFRSAHALGYPVAGLLALIAVASFCGVARGKKDLAAFATTLSPAQRRALRFRLDAKTKEPRCPGVTTFFRVLTEVDEVALEKALLLWQEQMLGPVQDRVIALDGKKLRHSQGGELVSAFGVESGRWLGTVRTSEQTNEIPMARELLRRMDERLDLSGKLVVLDALHTQQETARQVVQELGSDYLLTLKDNQKAVNGTACALLKPHAFSPSATGQTAGEKPRSL